MMDKLSGMEQTVNEIRDALKKKAIGSSGGNNVNTVRIDAGGIGVWACLTAALVSMCLCIVMAVMYMDVNRKYDRVQDLLSVIYQQAPWLKPQEETK